MPTSSTFNVIYLGRLPIIDPTEGTVFQTNYVAENASALVNQSFNDLTPASVQTFSPVSYGSNDGTASAPQNVQGYNQDNSRGDDTFNITDADGNVVQHVFDAIAQYRAVITYADGSTAQATVNVGQSTTGETWILPPSQYSADADILVTQPIQGIVLTSVVQNQTAGVYYDREVLDFSTVACFVRGTLIRTPEGDIPIEVLQAGDPVMTRDRGAQPIRWMGSRVLDAAMLQAVPNLRPIRVSTGALGKQLPSRDLLISPQHRVLVRSRIAFNMFDTDEVLVAAKSLVLLDGVGIENPPKEIEYFHMMFDQHEIVFSNGAETESFFPGPEALKGAGEAAQQELFTLFPELRDRAEAAPVRRILSGRMGRKLTMRHAQNRKPVQMT